METFDFTADWAEFQRKYPTRENAKLPLEDYADYLCDFRDLMLRHSFYHPGCREQLALARETIWEIKQLLLLNLESFPMNKKTIRTLFKLLFSLQFSLSAKLEIDIGARVENLERELETLKEEVSYLDHDLTKVEKKIKH